MHRARELWYGARGVKGGPAGKFWDRNYLNRIMICTCT